jgi:ribosomal protein L40E
LDFLEFDQVDLPPACIKAGFEFLEMEESRKPEPEPDGFLICRSCGQPNPAGSEYCTMCQGDLADFRRIELDTRTVRVKATFPRANHLVLCPGCGAFNERGARFCRECMGEIPPASGKDITEVKSDGS